MVLDEIIEMIREFGPVIPVRPTSVLFFIKDLTLDHLGKEEKGSDLHILQKYNDYRE